jgi:hypothetical protein
MATRFQIWSSGGGTQSTAIAILILQGKLPKPDFSFIADTGRETGETWEYLDRFTNPALAKIGLTVERLVPAQVPDIFNPKGTLLIPAFFTENAKASNFCSSYWKRDFVKRIAVQRGLVPAENWLGISTDEMRRVSTPRANNWLLRFPLVFDCPTSRHQCVQIIADYGWPKAPKSSCWMCPNRRDAQWIHLRDTRPDEFKKAVEFDKELRNRKPDAFLHDSRTPLGEVVLKEAPDGKENAQLSLCDSGECFV